MIPKTVHYVWLSDDEKPALTKKCIDSWKRTLTGYEIREWKMKDFQEMELPEFVTEAIAAKKYAFATDYLRMYLLYEYGGIYLDSDILLLKPLDAFLVHGFVSCIEYHENGFMPYRNRINEKGEATTEKHVPGFCIQAAFLGAEKGHPFAKKCMAYYENRHFLLKDGCYDMEMLAPDVYALCARKYGFLYRNEQQNFGDGVAIYPSFMVAGCLEESDKRNYAVHCCAGSWRDPEHPGIKDRLRNSARRKLFGTLTEEITEPDVSKLSVAFCVLARDCASAISNNLRKIESIRKEFISSAVYIVENNSVDNTKAIVSSYQLTHENVFADLFEKEDWDSRPRMDRMASARNRCLALLRESNFVPNLIIMIDGDIAFDEKAVMPSIDNAPDDWSAVFANGKYYLDTRFVKLPVLYYDLFAYVPWQSKKIGFTSVEMHMNREIIHRALRKNSYVSCDSAFGGVGIYRYEYIPDEGYVVEANVETDEFDSLCEHIPLNIKVGKNGTNYVCRGLTVMYKPLRMRQYLRAMMSRMKRITGFMSNDTKKR